MNLSGMREGATATPFELAGVAVPRPEVTEWRGISDGARILGQILKVNS
jgi:hypothetical protein